MTRHAFLANDGRARVAVATLGLLYWQALQAA